jgi:hypothetical protein
MNQVYASFVGYIHMYMSIQLIANSIQSYYFQTSLTSDKSTE